MANEDKADEEKPEYFYRLVCLVEDLGTEGLWKVFLKEIHSEIHEDVHGQTIQSFLASKKKDIDKLKKRRLLNDMQYATVEERMNKNESKFDISLLHVLIRNLTNLQEPVGGWNARYAVHSDHSPGANIVRLKMVRNEAIAHKSKCCMKKSEFEQFWAGAEDALLGLARYYGEEDIMKKKIDHIKKQDLFEEGKVQLDKLQKWKNEEECAEMITKIEEMKQKIAKHYSVPEDISSLKAAITSIQGQLNMLGMNSSLEGQSGFEARPGGPQTSELDAVKNRTGQMETNILQRVVTINHETVDKKSEEVDDNPVHNPQKRKGPRPTVSENNACSARKKSEGDGNSTSSTTRSNLYKRSEDLALSETVTTTLAEFMKSVGCLVIFQHGVRGTVFRVGDRYVITAFHVIEQIRDELYDQSVRVSADHSHPVVFVNFNECPTTPPKSIYRLKPPCFKDANLDIAILEIDNPDDHLPRGLPLCKLDENLSKVSCITYGHPGSSVKHLDPNCGVLQSNSNQVVTAIDFFMKKKSEISQALTIAGKSFDPNMAFSKFNDPSGFLLNSYFEHGGSGGPAIDHSRPLSCVVVGIFLKGYPTFFYDLPKALQVKYGEQHRFEMCRKTSSLYTTLQSHDTELAKNIF